MPRFSLTSLFGLVTLAAAVAALFSDHPGPRMVVAAFWPLIGAVGYLLLNAESGHPRAGRTVEEIQQLREYYAAYVQWRKRIIVAAFIVQTVWLPFGVALAVGIAVDSGMVFPPRR